MKRIIIYICLIPVLLMLSARGLGADEVSLPGTVGQVADFLNYYGAAPEEDLLFFINESLLFYRQPRYSDSRMWVNFKTRSQFWRMTLNKFWYGKDHEARNLKGRLLKMFHTRRRLIALCPQESRPRVAFDLKNDEEYAAARQLFKTMGLQMVRFKLGAGTYSFRLEHYYQSALMIEEPQYYQLLGLNPRVMEERLDREPQCRFHFRQCRVPLPWDFQFLNKVTGLNLKPETFMETLLNDARLPFLLGILYRLPEAEFRFIDRLAPGSGGWKKIYSNEKLLVGMLLLSHALRVENNRLRLPGGHEARRLWRSLTGADPLKEPLRFLETVALKDRGKLNYFYTFTYFLPPATRSVLFEPANAGKVKALYRNLSLSRGARLKGLRIPGLRDHDFFTLLYSLRSREGRIFFPGGVETWARAVGARTPGLFGLLDTLSRGTGARSKKKIRTFVALYSKFFNRAPLMTPSVLDTLFRQYPKYNVLVDYIERIPLREPQVVLELFSWVKRLQSLPAGKSEKDDIAAVLQGILSWLAESARHNAGEFDYDRVLRRLMKAPSTPLELYDFFFQFFKRLKPALKVDNADSLFMEVLTSGMRSAPVELHGQRYFLMAPRTLTAQISRLMKKQRACTLSQLVEINRLLNRLQQGGPGRGALARRLEDLFARLPHPRAGGRQSEEKVPYSWAYIKKAFPELDTKQEYSGARLFALLRRLTAKAGGGGSPGAIAALVKDIKHICLVPQLKHFLITAAYASAVKTPRARVFLNHNFARHHDFSPQRGRTPWNHSGFSRRVGEFSGFYLTGGLSRLNIMLAYPVSEDWFGKTADFSSTQSVPVLYNHLDLYPQPQAGRAQLYAGLMVSLAKHLLERVGEGAPLLPELARRLGLITAGNRYREVMTRLNRGTGAEVLSTGELFRLGEAFFAGNRYLETFPGAARLKTFRETPVTPVEMRPLGSVYYHTFGMLKACRLPLFPQPLSHFFQSPWVGGEMIDELKLKAAYVSFSRRTPPELLGFLVYRYLYYAKRFFAQEYENDYERTYYMLDTYNYLQMERICRKLKTQGILKLAQ